MRSALAVMLIGSMAGVVWGWSTFWFLCDDAYIAFRYVSSSMLGWGYTFNPPPFLPVEGYTSFLWVLLLDLVWRSTEVKPPAASNWLSLGFALLTIPMLIRLAWCSPQRHRTDSTRLVLVGMVLVGTLSNRTWLAWTSSGLETAMFTFLVLGWTAVGLTCKPGRGTVASLCVLAALLELGRPDGLIYWGAAALIGAWWLRRVGRPSYKDVVALSPLASPVLHVAWRWSVYGALLPNTYYAKSVGWKPLSGLIYLVSFLLEYALWVWVVVALVAMARGLARRDALGGVSAPRSLVLGAVVGHFGFYTFRIGGDHFEYRIYVHLIPLMLASLPWLWERAGGPERLAHPILAAMIALGLVIPWTHWVHAREVNTREESLKMAHRGEPHLPSVMGWYVRPFDLLQTWMIRRFMCARQQEHRVFGDHQRATYPTRHRGLQVPLQALAVLEVGGVGVPGWTMPHVAIIDRFGLNDHVVARTPIQTHRRRYMGHARLPPPGYVECFRPNVRIVERQIVIDERDPPMVPEDIIRCERRYRRAVGE